MIWMGKYGSMNIEIECREVWPAVDNPTSCERGERPSRRPDDAPTMAPMLQSTAVATAPAGA